MEFSTLLYTFLPYILIFCATLIVLAKVMKLPTTGWREVIAQQLRRPTGAGFFGWFVKRVLRTKNEVVTLNAVRLCRLEKQHKVLEVGFGPGLGLKAATRIIEAGSGKVHGIDFSCEMMREASRLLEAEVIQGKVELVLGDAACLPYQDNIMDRVYHCNCYYFWPDVEQVCRELYRVLKPGGFMITNLNVANLQASDKEGFMQYAKWDPKLYMDALKRTGFAKVEMTDEHCEKKKATFQSIFAEKLES